MLFPRCALAPLLLCVACAGASEPAPRVTIDPSVDATLDGPAFLRLDGDDPRGADPLQTARLAARRHAEAYRLSTRALDACAVEEEALPGGATLVRWQQRADGVPVGGGALAVIVDGSGRAIALSGRLDPRPPRGPAPTGAGIADDTRGAAQTRALDDGTGAMLARLGDAASTCPAAAPAPRDDDAMPDAWTAALDASLAALVASHGADGGRDRMLRLLTLAPRLTPATPTLIEARDALLTATALLDGDRGDQRLVWTAFAGAGLGDGAEAPPRRARSLRGLVASFDTPWQPRILTARIVEADHSCDNDGILDAGELGALVVRLRPGDHAAELAVDVSGPPEVSFPAGRHVLAPDGARLDGRAPVELRVPLALVEAPADGRITLTVTATGGDAAHPRRIAAEVDRDRRYGAVDDVAAASTPWSAAGWRRVTDGGDARWRADCDGDDATLVSPPISDDGGGHLRLAFDQRATPGGHIEISTGAGAWADVTARARTSAGSPLAHTVIDLGDAFHARRFWVRFRVACVGAARWELDNVAVSGLRGAPFYREVGNHRSCPLVDAGPNQTVDGGADVHLGGRASRSRADEALAYAWAQIAGPAVALRPRDEGLAFTAPRVGDDTELRFRLTVRATGRPAPASDLVSVWVRAPLDPAAEARAGDPAHTRDRGPSAEIRR